MPETYSRQAPSPRYQELVALYKRMHTEGDTVHGIAPEDTFTGKSLPPHAMAIKKLIDSTGARTLLDYGSGKGQQYTWQDIELPDGQTVKDLGTYWGLEEITKYDPGYQEFWTLPSGQFDGVICTDVMEHCPEADVPWIVEELFGFARLFLYVGVACYPAKKVLPNGENAHCTVRPPEWWAEVVREIAARHPKVHYRFVLGTKGENKPYFGLFGKPKRSWSILEGSGANGSGGQLVVSKEP